MAAGKSYKRGEVFTVTQVTHSPQATEVLVAKTDYAHYLYCQNVELLGEYGVRIIHTASFVDTADGYTIVGEMGPQTARHGFLQLCGGGIDNDDLRGEFFDMTHNISKELQEELGIDVADTARVAYFGEAYFKQGGPSDKMTVIFRVELRDTKEEFLEKYAAFTKQLTEQGEEPEFGEIIMLKKDQGVIQEFFAQDTRKKDEYIQPAFEERFKI